MTSTSVNNRNAYIDILRATGLILLFVAHTMPPFWMQQIRSFDVPLMVFISSICFHYKGNYIEYVIRRFKRIYIPAFIFLCIFFLAVLFVKIITGFSVFSISQVVGSFLLLDKPSIGYVWIMRIFILIAIVLPVLKYITKKVNAYQLIILIIALLVCQEYLVSLTPKINNKYFCFLFNEGLLYTCGYSLIAIVAIKMNEFTKTDNSLITVCLLLLTLGITIHQGSFNPTITKYPPHSLYVTYGLLICAFLWRLKPTNNITLPTHIMAIVNYLSRRSMWVYLWHIIPSYAIHGISWPENSWGIRFILVFIVAIILDKTFLFISRFLPSSLAKQIQ